jgi:glucose-6-phosphate 1-epimerase
VLNDLSLDVLSRRFSPTGAVWRRGPGDLPFLDVETPRCRAVLTPYGGQLCEWTPAPRTEPVVWRSPRAVYAEGKAIRGGVPICFPWFGNHPSDAKRPAHGFARTRAWEIVEVADDDDDVVVRFRLVDDAATRSLWDATFAAGLEIALGSTLSLRFDVENRGRGPITAEVALHAYFGVGDVERIRIHGLERTRFLDKVDGGVERRQGDESLAIVGEVDRVFLDTPVACEIEDPVLDRRIRIEKSGSLATVVWNPGPEKAAAMADVGDAWPRFVCVETACCGPHALRLEPGERHAVEARISVADL